MEDPRARRTATVLLQREFAGSRLEKQIVMRAFELVVPVDGAEPIAEEPGKVAADQLPVIAARSQGGPQS